MTLRRLKQALGFAAAKGGSDPLYVKVSGEHVPLPVEALVRVHDAAGVVYFGVPKPRSELLVLEGGVLRPVQEDEAAEIYKRIGPPTRSPRNREEEEALAAMEEALAVVRQKLPPNVTVTVGRDGRPQITPIAHPRHRPEEADLSDLDVPPQEGRSFARPI